MAATTVAIAPLLEASGMMVASLQRIFNKKKSDEQKLAAAETSFETRVLKTLGAKGRFLFGVDQEKLGLEDFSLCVAVEELFDCYLEHCRSHSGGFSLANTGCIYAVYGEQGSGKSRAAQALVITKHQHAPRFAIFFGGKLYYKDGDQYFKFLLNVSIAGKKVDLHGLSKRAGRFDSGVGTLSPGGLASFLLNNLPVGNEYLNEDNSRWGVWEVPGVKDYLDSRASSDGVRGGTPVIVFEDVNISLSDPEDRLSDAKQRDKWIEELGTAGELFSTLVHEGHVQGTVIFVTTNQVNIARFFRLINANTKATTHKPLRHKNFICQYFGWTREKRSEFLKIQNELRDESWRLGEDEIETIVEASVNPTSLRPLSIREMHINFKRQLGWRPGPANTSCWEMFPGYTCPWW